MRRVIQFGSIVGLLAISGCTTTNYAYERIGYGPELEYAKAECEILSMGTEKDFYARGDSYQVAGAMIGHAIETHVRATNFQKNCMIMNGWKQVPLDQKAKATPVAYAKPAQRRQFRQERPTLHHKRNSPYNPYGCRGVCARGEANPY